MITVYFDGDQTLWDFQALMHRTMAATSGELVRLRSGVEGDLSVAALVADRDAVAHELSAAAHLEEVRLRAFRRSLQRLRVPDDGDELAGHLTSFYLERRWAGMDLYADTLPTLRALTAARGRIRVGLVSNGN